MLKLYLLRYSGNSLPVLYQINSTYRYGKIAMFILVGVDEIYSQTHKKSYVFIHIGIGVERTPG